MGWTVKRGYGDAIYATENLDDLIDFIKKLLSPNNSVLVKGTSIEIKVTHSQWDNQENQADEQ